MHLTLEVLLLQMGFPKVFLKLSFSSGLSDRCEIFSLEGRFSEDKAEISSCVESASFPTSYGKKIIDSSFHQ